LRHLLSLRDHGGGACTVFPLVATNVFKTAFIFLCISRWVARLEGIDESTLGRKGKSGILKSVASRREFLEDIGHRIRFVFTPKHSSCEGVTVTERMDSPPGRMPESAERPASHYLEEKVMWLSGAPGRVQAGGHDGG